MSKELKSLKDTLTFLSKKVDKLTFADGDISDLNNHLKTEVQTFDVSFDLSSDGYRVFKCQMAVMEDGKKDGLIRKLCLHDPLLTKDHGNSDFNYIVESFFVIDNENTLIQAVKQCMDTWLSQATEKESK